MSPETKKKKKSIFRRILKYTGILFLVLIITIILIPIFFKDELKNLAIAEANKMLNAEIAVGDFDLTIFSTFPKMKLSFDDVSITGKGEFEGVKLIDVKTFEAKLDFWSVINMEDIQVRSVRLIEPNIHVKVLQSGLANYDIMKSTEEMAEEGTDTTSAPFKFSLEYYEIKDGNIIYDDRLSPMYAELVNVNHTGKGDMTADVIDFQTMTKMDELTFKYDGLTYLSKVKTDLDMDILMEFKEGSDKFTLKDNELSLNALKLSFDGFYEMFKDYDDMDLKLVAQNTSFKDLLSLIPAFYHSGYESMIAKGNLSLNAFVKGQLDDARYPAWDFAAKVNGASIAYPDMPASIDNVSIIAGSKFPGGSNLDLMTIDIDQLKASFVGNTIDANFYMKNPMTDPYMKSKIHLNVDLASIGQVYPLEEGEEYNGKLTSDISIEGRMSTLEKEEYDKFDAKGTLRIQDMHYASKDLPAGVDIENLLFEFSPQQLKLAELKAKMGKSDFSMDGEVKNYMGYFFNEGDLQGVFNYHSNLLDVDEIMPPSEEGATAESSSTTAPTETTSAGDEEVMLVPEKVDFVLNTTINKIIYDGMEITNLKGRVILRNQEAILENLNMLALGGSVGLSGKYNTQNKAVPKMDFSYSLKNLDIEDLARNFLTIEKLAPVAKYTSGRISSDFTMTTSLQPSFEPIYSTLNGSGTLHSDEVTISGFKVLEKLGDALNNDKLKKQTLKDVHASFEFAEGKVRVKPFDIKMGKINTTVGGTTSFEQEIDYEIKMNIPKEEIPGELLKIAEQAIAKAKNIPGFNMKELPANIPITALVSNTITDPKVSTNLKEKLLELGGDIKGGVKDLVDEKVQDLKDTVRAVVDGKIDEAKAALEKKKQELIEGAQKQADGFKAEGKKLADQTRAQAEKSALKTINDAGDNPIRKKTAEIAAKAIRDEGEKAAQKIESEANTRADNFMKDARERANNLKE